MDKFKLKRIPVEVSGVFKLRTLWIITVTYDYAEKAFDIWWFCLEKDKHLSETNIYYIYNLVGYFRS